MALTTSATRRTLISIISYYIAFGTVRVVALTLLEVVYLVQASNLHPLTRHKEEHLQRGPVYRWLGYLGAHYRYTYLAAVLIYAIYSVLFLSFYYITYRSGQRTLKQNLDFHLFLERPGASFSLVRDNLSQLKLHMRNSYLSYLKSEREASHRVRGVEQDTQMATIESLEYWPANRNEAWHGTLNKIWTRISIIFIFYNFMALNSLLLIIRAVILGNANGLSFIDRLSLVEESIMTNFLTERFVFQVVKLISSEVDQRKLYTSVGLQLRGLKHLLERSVALYQWQCTLRRATTSRQPPFELKRLLLLRDRCNRKCLELYLGYRYMLRKQEQQKHVANDLISQWIFFLVGSMCAVVLCSKQIELRWLRFLMPIIILVYLFTMIICSICSSTSSQLHKNSSVIWSLLAHSILAPAAGPLERRPSRRDLYLWPEVADVGGPGHFREPDKPAASSELLLNAHTRLLWFRLVRDENQIARSYTYKILGFLPLNYRSLLKLNFWLISLVLATMSNSLFFLSVN